MRLHPAGAFDNRVRVSNLIEVRPLAAAMGAEVCGLDLRSLSEKAFAEVRDALFRHKMIFFRGQDLTHADHEAFSLWFGPYAEDAYTSGIPGHRDVHPVTGEKALYLDNSYAIGIEGMTEEEARPLLDFLAGHVARHAFTCRVRREPDMLVVWDNRLCAHHAFNDYQGFRREMDRTTVGGEVPA